MFQKTFAIFAAALMALSMSFRPAHAADSKEAVIWHWFTEEEVQGFRPMLQGVVSVDPEATFRFEKLPIGTWSVEENSREALLMLADEGRPLADLSFAEPSAVAELAGRGMLRPMPEGVKLPKPLHFASLYKDEILMLPFGSYSYALAYDPKRLADAGYPDGPKTWAELVDAAKKMTVDEDGDGTPERYGLGLKMRSGRALEMPDLFLYLYQSKGGRIKVEGGSLAWDRAAAEWAFAQFYDGGYRWMAPPSVAQWADAGMQIVDTDRPQVVTDKYPGWKVVMLPAVEGNLRLPMRSYSLVLLNSGRPGGAEAADAIIKYFSKPQMAGLIAQETGFFPINRSASASTFAKSVMENIYPLPLFEKRQLLDDLLLDAVGDAFGRLQEPAALADYVEKGFHPEGPRYSRLPAGGDGAISPYGMAHGQDWKEMHNVGVRWARLDYRIHETEQPDGSFNWDNINKITKAGLAEGVNVLGLLSDSSPRTSMAPEDIPGAERNGFMTKPEAWAEYVRSAARDAGPYVKVWEVRNEPNIEVFWHPVPNAKRYAEALKSAYVNLKSVDPTITVMAAGVSGIPMRWFERLYENGATDYLDAWAIHPYIELKDLDDGAYIEQLKMLRRQLDRYGERKPIWITEVGFAMEENREAEAVDAEGQALGVIKTHCQTFASRAVDKIIWYHWSDGPFGLGRGDGKKPSYYSYAFVVKELGHEPNLVDYYRAANGDEYYLFDRNGVPVLIAWNGQKESVIDFSVQSDAAGVFNYLGEPIAVGASPSGGLALKVDTKPIFIEGKNGDLDAFRQAYWMAVLRSEEK